MSATTLSKCMVIVVLKGMVVVMIYYRLCPFASDLAKENAINLGMILTEQHSSNESLVIGVTRDDGKYSVTPSTGTTAVVVAVEGIDKVIRQ